MKFSEFCTIAENTEQEQQFMQFVRAMEEMEAIKEAIPKMQRVPVLGKVLTAVVALAESEGITAFKQTEHYQAIKDWNITFDPEKRDFSMNPSTEQVQKIVKIVSVAASVIAVLLLCRKILRRKSKK